MNHRDQNEEQSWGRRMLPWAVLLLTSLALLYFVGKGAETANAPQQDETEDTLQQTEVGEWILRLPDGSRIMASSGSFEALLFDALEKDALNTTTAFTLDEVAFRDSATLSPAAHPQLDNLVTILKAYPSVSIRIEGQSTDPGSPGRTKLHAGHQFAMRVARYLKERGIAEDRMRVIGRTSGQSPPDNTAEDSSESIQVQIDVYIES